MEIINECRATVALHHGRAIYAGVDTLGIYLELPDEVSSLIAEAYSGLPN
jgi:hypothetical protein